MKLNEGARQSEEIYTEIRATRQTLALNAYSNENTQKLTRA